MRRVVGSGRGVRRVVALVVDVAVVWLLVLVALRMVSLVLVFTSWGDGPGQSRSGAVAAVMSLLGAAVAVGYVVVGTRRGGTVGARMVRRGPPWRSERRDAPPAPGMGMALPAPAAASWSRRLLALLFDLLIVGLLCVPAGAVLFMPLFGLGMELAPPDLGMGGLAYGVMVWFGGTLLLVTALYFVAGDATGGTWGKRRLRLEVVGPGGERLGWARSALRQVVKLAVLGSVLGAVVNAASADGRGWHDRVAGSAVVRRPGGAPAGMPA